MSEKNKETVFDPEALVDYRAPIDSRGESRDITVGVNGEFIRRWWRATSGWSGTPLRWGQRSTWPLRWAV